MILHCDGNSFYASCEQIYRPDLRGKPVAVLSNNDGIIIALNAEAKKCNIKRGDPYFKIKDICAKNNISVFSSNYTLYADISRRITSIYMEYAPQIEEYSIDESFLFFDKCNWSVKDYTEIGFDLKKRIAKEVGIPICVGAAPTKTLAKLYNKNAKKHNGVYIYEAEKVDALLAETDCQTIWGIGPAKARKLRENKITTALELKNMPLNEAKKLLTIQGIATVQELRGIPYIDRIDKISNDVITSSRQFGIKVFSVEVLESAVVQYTEAVVEKLRKQKAEAGAVSVYLSTCNYYCDNKELQYSNGIYLELDRLTSYTADIVKAATIGLRRIFREGFGYRSVMITLHQLRPACLQGNLFIDPMNDIKKKDFMDSLDKLNNSYGRKTVRLAKGTASGEGWQMQRKLLSPCWTTRIGDIPHIK
ncbi:MAG: Y-family DNA polymerase [Treponema sp.]|nr:Y-family DNA polymerase [Treponema sp.]